MPFALTTMADWLLGWTGPAAGIRRVGGSGKKVENDVMDDYYDETSYASNTFFESAMKPGDVAFIERIKHMREAGATEHTICA